MPYIEHEPAIRPALEQRVAGAGGWLLPPLTWPELAAAPLASLDSIPAPLRVATEGRQTPQPFTSSTKRLILTNPAGEALPKIGILCGFPAAVRQLIAAGHPMGTMMAGPEWRFMELPPSHWPIFSAPDALAELLDCIARGDG